MKLLILTLLLCVAATAAANDLGYAVDTNLDLWVIDFTSLTADFVGNMGVFLESIATAPNGDLYGATSAGEIYLVDGDNASATFIGASGLGNIEGLDFNGSMLVAVNFSSPPSAYEIDTSNGSASFLVQSDMDTGAVRSASFRDATTLYMRGDANGSTLFAMNINTGQTTVVGPQGVTIYGQDFINGNYYGVSVNGTIYSIDPDTGADIFIGDVGDQFFLGLTDYAGVTATRESSWGALKNLY